MVLVAIMCDSQDNLATSAINRRFWQFPIRVFTLKPRLLAVVRRAATC
jgi:hypothetical protein